MTYCMLDNLLLYLCLKGCVFKVSSSGGGWGGGGFDVCARLEKVGEGAWWAGGGGESKVTITTGLYQECLHQGRGQDRVCPLQTGTFFAPKSPSKRSFFFQGHYGWMRSELKKDFFPFFSF